MTKPELIAKIAQERVTAGMTVPGTTVRDGLV